jgi:peptidoglycan DL-endopeptidase CwlO
MPTTADLQAYANSQAIAYGIPPGIFTNLIGAESSWNPNAVSPAGAQGIAQLMPGTAGGIDPFDPYAALTKSAQLLKGYFDQFGNWPDAVAAYNAGPGAVTKYGGIPPYPETQNYVSKILGGLGIGGANMQGATKIIFWAAAALIGIIVLGAFAK